MRRFALSLLCTALAAQQGPSVAPPEPSLHPADSILLAKAPEHPAYGLVVAAPAGKFLLTDLRYDPVSPAGRLVVYRIAGPGAWGPYRLGMSLVPNWDTYAFEKDHRVNGPATSGYSITRVDRGGPADRAGLDDTWKILQVDGQPFSLCIPELFNPVDGTLHWMPRPSLVYQNDSFLRAYATYRPTIDVLAQKRSGWGKGKEKHFLVQLGKQATPADPGEVEIFDSTNVEQVLQMVRPQLTQPGIWQTLAHVRSTTHRFTPLAVEMNERTWWVVRSGTSPSRQHAIGRDAGGQVRWLIRDKAILVPGVAESQNRVFLEFWRENPAGGAPSAAPDFLCAEPSDHVLKGRLLRLQDRWYRVTDATLDPADGRLAKLAVQPWSPDIDSLLGGVVVGQDLGPSAPLADWSFLEQSANDDLLKWKIRKLPSALSDMSLEATEDLVFRLEKGVLALDLKVRDLRARLDAVAREEAERRAQAELAVRQGKPAPRFNAFPAAEVEQIANLLDQRKAILMAILGSAKQALAQMRR